MDKYFPCRDHRDESEKLDAVTIAVCDALCEWSQPIVHNYAEVNQIPWEDSAAAVGKAMVVNGVCALAVCMTDMEEIELAELCDDVLSLIAGRVIERVQEQEAAA